jgi:hypothetical protein
MVFTVVAQLGKRRPLLKKAAGESGGLCKASPVTRPRGFEPRHA